MVKIAMLTGLGIVGALFASAPAGTTVAMLLACTVGFGAVRFHAAAESLVLGGAPAAASMLRLARFCDDLALALCLLALLFGIHPF